MPQIPNATDEQIAFALSGALAEATTTSFTGPIETPETIGGVKVTGSAVTDDGGPGFLLEDGTVVSKDLLVDRENALAVLQAASVLASDKAPEDKFLALASIGIDRAAANDLISTSQGNTAAAVVSLANLGFNFDEMSSLQQLTSVLQTGNLVYQSLSTNGLIPSSRVVSGALSRASGVATIVLGIDQAADVFSAIEDLPRSQAVKEGIINGAAIGATIGMGVGAATGATVGTSILPGPGTVIGSIIGAIVGGIGGSVGSGKGKGQKIRDAWRGNLESLGIATKIDGSHNVTLADGTKYDIGRDGGSKLTNKDGTERFTFDVDWGNETAVNAIPDAHLFAIATGFDPSATDFDAFTRVATQALNAATSNTDDPAEVQANFRAMLEQGGVDPLQLGLKVELLRQTNKITEQEYTVYLSRLNDIFETKLIPIDKETGRMQLVKQLLSAGENLGEPEQELLELLTDKQKYAESEQALAERVQSEKEKGTQ